VIEKENKKGRITVNVTDKEKEIIDNEARKEGRTTSNYVLNIIINHIKNNEKK